MAQPSPASANSGSSTLSWKERRLPTVASLRRAALQGEGDENGIPGTVAGWLAGRRSSGRLLFLNFRDGSGFAQVVVFQKAVSSQAFEAARHCPLESAVEIRGAAFAEPRAPGGMELRAADFRVIHTADPYPITPKEHGASFLLDRRHLWLRSRRQHALLRIRDEVLFAFREYLRDQDFICGDTPIFTPNACEGTTTLFETQYFDRHAYLSQSGQLYNEAIAMSVGRTYCLGPTFRAEKSKTRRHLIEFWMLEPEVAFAELGEIVELAEGLICHAVDRVLTNRAAELETLNRDPERLRRIQAPFPRITYDEAAARLAEMGTDFTLGDDFGARDETALTEGMDRPLVVTHFPSAIKAFYMEPAPGRPDRVLGMDILAPEGYGEIVGGGQRIHDHDLLRERVEEHGLPEEAFAWYLDLRRFGSVPHSGFGLGIERFVAWMSGISHLREAIPFPRTLYRLSP